jgi:putative transposase
VLLGWVEREQRNVIDFLREENRALKAQLRGRRIRLTDDQRRRLAVLGHQVGRRALRHIATLVTPDTILRWHRELVAQKWTCGKRRPGRPGVPREIRRLVIRMASENPGWLYPDSGSASESGSPCGSDHDREDPEKCGPSADARPTDVLADVPAGALAGTARGGLLHHWSVDRAWACHDYTLFVIELESRRVHIVGSTPHPDEAFMLQVMRQLTDDADGALHPGSVLICDRDRKWSGPVLAFLRSAGVHVVQTPARAPNCNAHAERFIWSIKFECLHRLIPLGERHLRHAIREYVAHYHHERNHQGLDNELIVRLASSRGAGTVRRAQRLGGLLNFYHRAA